MGLFLMSPPGTDWQLRGRANFRSEGAAPVDAKKARKEWLALAEAIEARGGTVVVLPPVSGLTGLPYAAECGHAVGGRFLLPRMAAEHRKAERLHWGPLAAKMGFEVVPLRAGTWEAQGDVATLDGVTILFHGGRTDAEGLAEARKSFDGEVILLEVRQPAFHGNMALLPIERANRLLVCAEVVAGDGVARLVARFGAERVVRVSEDEILHYATNGLPIADAWLAPSLVPARVRELVASFGVDVVALAMDELCGKGGGASRCLVCHVPDPPAQVRVPDENRLAPFADEIRRDA